MRVRSPFLCVISLFLFAFGLAPGADANDIDEIRTAGVLRHLGVPYANFVTGSGDGLDVELIQGFAKHLGVGYAFVETDWTRMIGDLTGRHARNRAGNAERLEEAEIRGDVIANGMTILGWREQVVAFAEPTFPTAVWLVALAESSLRPIAPAGSLDGDIAQVKGLLRGVSVLTSPNSCLDSTLYDLDRTGADIRIFTRNPSEMVPGVMRGEAETTLLDVPDALIALDRWPGQVKILGPISEHQLMAPAFRPNAPSLRAAFNAYMAAIRADGHYDALVRKYYPAVFRHYETFFAVRH